MHQAQLVLDIETVMEHNATAVAKTPASRKDQDDNG